MDRPDVRPGHGLSRSENNAAYHSRARPVGAPHSKPLTPHSGPQTSRRTASGPEAVLRPRGQMPSHHPHTPQLSRKLSKDVAAPNPMASRSGQETENWFKSLFRTPLSPSKPDSNATAKQISIGEQLKQHRQRQKVREAERHRAEKAKGKAPQGSPHKSPQESPRPSPQHTPRPSSDIQDSPAGSHASWQTVQHSPSPSSANRSPQLRQSPRVSGSHQASSSAPPQYPNVIPGPPPGHSPRAHSVEAFPPQPPRQASQTPYTHKPSSLSRDASQTQTQYQPSSPLRYQTAQTHPSAARANVPVPPHLPDSRHAIAPSDQPVNPPDSRHASQPDGPPEVPHAKRPANQMRTPQDPYRPRMGDVAASEHLNGLVPEFPNAIAAYSPDSSPTRQKRFSSLGPSSQPLNVHFPPNAQLLGAPAYPPGVITRLPVLRPVDEDEPEAAESPIQSESEYAKLSSYKPPAPSRLDGVQLSDIEGPGAVPPGMVVVPKGVSRLIGSMKRRNQQPRRVSGPGMRWKRRSFRESIDHGKRQSVMSTNGTAGDDWAI